MNKYLTKLFRTAKSVNPVHTRTLYFKDDASLIDELPKLITRNFFALIENLENGEVKKLFVSPRTMQNNTLGYLPNIRICGGLREKHGIFIVGVRPVISYPYKDKLVFGHSHEFKSKTLNSKYPPTRAFHSNQDLALKYYKQCALELNKKGILLNLSLEAFYSLHESRILASEAWDVYSEINNKNENTRIIF